MADPKLSLQIGKKFETSSNCGGISLVVTSDTQAVVYQSKTGTLEIYSDDVSLDGTNHEVVIESYLTDYPQITGKAVSYFVKFFAVTVDKKEDPYIVSSNLPPELKADPPQITNLLFDKSAGDVYKEPKLIATLSNPEGDLFSVTFSGLQSFMTATYDEASGEIKFSIDEATAVNGNYTLSY